MEKYTQTLKKKALGLYVAVGRLGPLHARGQKLHLPSTFLPGCIQVRSDTAKSVPLPHSCFPRQLNMTNITADRCHERKKNTLGLSSLESDMIARCCMYGRVQ